MAQAAEAQGSWGHGPVHEYGAGLDALEAEVLKKKPRRSGLEVEEDIELLLFRLGHVGQMSVTTEIET